MTRQVVEGGINWSEAYKQLKERHGNVILDPFLFIRGYRTIALHEGGNQICLTTELTIPHALGRRFGRREVQLRQVAKLKFNTGQLQTDVLEASFDPQQNGIVVSVGREVRKGREVHRQGRYVFNQTGKLDHAEVLKLPGDKTPQFPDMSDFSYEKGQIVDYGATVAAMLKSALEGGRPFQRIRYERPSSYSRPRKATPKAS